MKKLVKLRNRLEKMSYCKFISLQLTLSLLISIIQMAVFLSATKIFDLPKDWAGEPWMDFSLPHFINITWHFLIGALIETIVFQYCTFFVFYKLISTIRETKSSPILYILASSFLFGLFHLNGSGSIIGMSIIRVIMTAFIGIVLSVSFYITYRKKQKPLLTVSLIHFLYNEIVIGVQVLASLSDATIL